MAYDSGERPEPAFDEWEILEGPGTMDLLLLGLEFGLPVYLECRCGRGRRETFKFWPTSLRVAKRRCGNVKHNEDWIFEGEANPGPLSLGHVVKGTYSTKTRKGVMQVSCAVMNERFERFDDIRRNY